MTDDKYLKYLLACALRPIVGGNPALDGIIKEGVALILGDKPAKTEAEIEKHVEEPVIEEPKAGV